MAVGQKKWLPTKGLDAYDAIQCMVEWQMRNGSKFNQTLLTNWIDPETSSSMSDQKIKLVGTTGRFESDQHNIYEGLICVLWTEKHVANSILSLNVSSPG